MNEDLRKCWALTHENIESRRVWCAWDEAWIEKHEARAYDQRINIMLRFAPILFFWTYLSFLVITHPPHVISPLTTLVFVIASFHPLPRTSLTHSRLLIVLLRNSIAFHHVPFALSSFWNFPSLRYINPQLATYFPKLDLLCTLVHCHINLVLFSFSYLWLFASLHQCSVSKLNKGQ